MGVRDKELAFCVGLVVSFLGATAAHAGGLTGWSRSTHIQDAVAICKKQTREAGFNEAFANKYCICMATRSADILTTEDMVFIAKNGAITPEIEKKLDTAADVCLKSMKHR